MGGPYYTTKRIFSFIFNSCELYSLTKKIKSKTNARCTFTPSITSLAMVPKWWTNLFLIQQLITQYINYQSKVHLFISKLWFKVYAGYNFLSNSGCLICIVVNQMIHKISKAKHTTQIFSRNNTILESKLPHNREFISEAIYYVLHTSWHNEKVDQFI